MDAGQTWLMRMSARWDEVGFLRSAASEEDFELEVEEVVAILERSFSIVCEEKYGSENPCMCFELYSEP